MNETYQRSVISTGYDDGMQDGIKKGRAEGMLEVAKNLLSMHLPIMQIMQATGLTQEQINRLNN